MNRPVRVLLVEDNELDARMALRTAAETKLANNITVVQNGSEAPDLLHRTASDPDTKLANLMLLDLSLPGLSGHDLLAEVKSDPRLRHIPVVVLTSSAAMTDIKAAYNGQAAAFITKPLGMAGFLEVVKAIEGFYVEIVTLASPS